jgi:hypothetical protein
MNGGEMALVCTGMKGQGIEMNIFQNSFCGMLVFITQCCMFNFMQLSAEDLS